VGLFTQQRHWPHASKSAISFGRFAPHARTAEVRPGQNVLSPYNLRSFTQRAAPTMNQRLLPVSDTFITELCDADRGWGLFLFLRPKPEQRLTVLRTVLMALIPGIVLGAFGSMLLELAAVALEQPPVPRLAFPLSLVFLYFVACWSLVAPAWNRRAERLARSRRYGA
jgi:hypothetical protein